MNTRNKILGLAFCVVYSLFFSPSSAFSQSIAFDAYTNGTSSNGGANTFSFSHTTSGTKRLLIVSIIDGSNSNTITSVTYNSVPMTQIGSGASGGGYGYAVMFGLINPAVGSNTVTINRSGVGDRIYASAVSYTGVKQAGFPDAHKDVSNGGQSSVTGTITTVADNAVVVAEAVSQSNNTTAATSGVFLGTIGNPGSTDGSYVYTVYQGSPSPVTPAGNLAMTINGGTSSLGLTMVSFAPALLPPTVTTINPTSGTNINSVSIASVGGTGFISGATVSLTKSGQADIPCTGFTFTNSTTLSSGSCPINGAAAGTWNIVVTNPDAQTGTLSNGFTINNPTPATVDWNNGNVQEITLTTARSFTFTNGKNGGVYSLLINQDGTGGYYVTWPSDIKWASGTAPTLTSTASAIAHIRFIYNGTYYLESGIYQY